MSTGATKRWRARLSGAALILGFSVLALSGLGASTASAANTVTATFTINGHSTGHTSGSNAIKLNPASPANIGVTVTNNGSSAITVTAIALSGKALNVTFFDFETQTALQVAPGSSASQQFTIDLAPLNGQGDGLIPATVRLLDAKRHTLASQNFTADVRGRITSLFGLFGIEVTVFTILLFLGALYALARGKLHENRFRRGIRFMWPGIGLGVVLVFVLAVFRVFVPSPGHWLPIVLICLIAGFVVGYLTPNPANDELEVLPDPDGTITPASSGAAGTADPHSTLPIRGG